MEPELAGRVYHYEESPESLRLMFCPVLGFELQQTPTDRESPTLSLDQLPVTDQAWRIALNLKAQDTYCVRCTDSWRRVSALLNLFRVSSHSD